MTAHCSKTVDVLAKRATCCDVPPLHEWRRHHPHARMIANELGRFPDLFRLRSKTLVRDVMDKYRVGMTTAFVALRIAKGLDA